MSESDHRLGWYLSALLVAAGWLVFGGAIEFEFVTTEDQFFIVENPLVTDWWNATPFDRLFTIDVGYPIPVTVASWALDYYLWNGNAGGLHFVNVLLHLVNTLLVFCVVRRLVADWPAFFGAAVFLLHPIQVEAVAFISQRKDLLATVFSLLALERLTAMSRARFQWRKAAWVILAVILASLSKPSALLLGPTMAVAWLALSGFCVAGFAQRLFVRILLYLLPLVLLLCSLNIEWTGPLLLAADVRPLTFGQRVTLIGQTTQHYVTSLFFPISLAPKVLRPIPAVDGAALVAALTAWAAFAAAAVAAIRQREALWVLVLAWVLGAYLPISNLVPLQRFAADSLLYLSMPGVALCTALLVQRRWPESVRRRWVAVGTTMCVLAGAGIASIQQLGLWRNEETLSRFLYERYPENTGAMEEYATYLRRQGEPLQALAVEVEFLQRAIRQKPSSMFARQRLVRGHLALGRVVAARKTLEDAPRSARERVPYWESRLEIAVHEQRLDDALAAVHRICEIEPESPWGRLIPALELAIDNPGRSGKPRKGD